MEPISDDHPFVLEFIEVSTALKRAIEQDFAQTHRIYHAKPDDPFTRRLLVRGVMLYIEGQMGAIRENLLFFHHYFTDEQVAHDRLFTTVAERLNLHLSVKDYFALVGKSIKSLKKVQHADDVILDENLSTKESVKLMFHLHGQVFGHSISPAQDRDGWEALKGVKQKRNQLTHPKCAAHLDVTYEQARSAIRVFLWLQSCLEKIREIEDEKWGTLCDELLGKQ